MQIESEKGAVVTTMTTMTSTTGRRLDVSARDRRTLEVRQHFAVPHEQGVQAAYETRVWLYFPRGFGITPQTWTVEDFYRDANLYMRLHAPGLTLKDFADLENPQNPAAVLRHQLPKLVEENAPTAEALDTLAKAMGAELADAVSTSVRHLLTAIDEVHIADDKEALVMQVKRCCEDVQRALGALRRLRAKARAYRSVAAPTLLPSLSLAEEYASAVVDERLAELAGAIDGSTALRDGWGTAVTMRLAVARTAEHLHRRRRDQGFPTPTGQHRTSPEHFTYRLGVLKKEMQRALYVDMREGRADPFWRNSAAMVAAGLAATWATLAQVPLLQGGLSSSQSALLFSAAVGAYVLKDRIKEWTRVLLTKKLLPWDHDERIVADALSRAGLGRLVGRAAEQATWVKDESIPRHIDEMRKRQRTVRGVAELENVLLYRRKVAFDGGDDPVPSGFGVQELLRISLDEVLKRLDDPIDDVSFYDPARGSFVRKGMPKVYHLNLVIETREPNGSGCVSRHRVIVNQQGITRIDAVGERTHHDILSASATTDTSPDASSRGHSSTSMAPVTSPSTIPANSTTSTAPPSSLAGAAGRLRSQPVRERHTSVVEAVID